MASHLGHRSRWYLATCSRETDHCQQVASRRDRLQCFVAPCLPVDGIVGMLQAIGQGLQNRTVGVKRTALVVEMTGYGAIDAASVVEGFLEVLRAVGRWAEHNGFGADCKKGQCNIMMGCSVTQAIEKSLCSNSAACQPGRNGMSDRTTLL